VCRENFVGNEECRVVKNVENHKIYSENALNDENKGITIKLWWHEIPHGRGTRITIIVLTRVLSWRLMDWRGHMDSTSLLLAVFLWRRKCSSFRDDNFSRCAAMPVFVPLSAVLSRTPHAIRTGYGFYCGRLFAFYFSPYTRCEYLVFLAVRCRRKSRSNKDTIVHKPN